MQSKFRRNGYVKDLAKFYVSLTNADGDDLLVTEDIVFGWDAISKWQNEAFKVECDVVHEFQILKNKMFLMATRGFTCGHL